MIRDGSRELLFSRADDDSWFEFSLGELRSEAAESLGRPAFRPREGRTRREQHQAVDV
jgi:hypothetical protein